VTSDQLAARVDAFARACWGRVRDKGNLADYDSGDTQRFEKMTPLELVVWAREEAQDLSNYAAMLDIQLQRIEERLRDLV